MLRNPSFPSINNFDFSLTKTDSGLIIEAESKLNGDQYSYTITPDEVSTLTKYLFTDIESLYGGLSEVMTDTISETPNTKVFIDKNGKLTFQHVTKIGSIERIFNFDIQLKEIETDRIGKLERQIVKINQKLIEYEKKFSELESRKGADFKLIHPVFNASNASNQSYVYSNQNKTIKAKSPNDSPYSSRSFPKALSQDALPTRGKYKFALKIENSSSIWPNFTIGITSGTSINNMNFSDYQECKHDCCLRLDSNQVCINGMSLNSNQSYKAQVGDTISILVDFETKEIFFEINDYRLFRGKFEPQVGLYPFVILSGNSDCLSFL